MAFYFCSVAYSASAAMCCGDCEDCDPEVAASPTPVATPGTSSDTPDIIPDDSDGDEIATDDMVTRIEFPVAASPDAHASTAAGIPSRSARTLLHILPADLHLQRTIVMGSSDTEEESDAASPDSQGLTVAASPDCQGPTVAACQDTEHAGNVASGEMNMPKRNAAPLSSSESDGEESTQHLKRARWVPL